MSGELEDFSLYLLIEKYCRLPVLNSRELLEIEMIAERESEIVDLPVSAPRHQFFYGFNKLATTPSLSSARA